MSAAMTPDPATDPTATPAPPSATNAAAQRAIGLAPTTRPFADGAAFEPQRGRRRSHPWPTSRAVAAALLAVYGAPPRRSGRAPANPHDQQRRERLRCGFACGRSVTA